MARRGCTPATIGAAAVAPALVASLVLAARSSARSCSSRRLSGALGLAARAAAAHRSPPSGLSAWAAAVRLRSCADRRVAWLAARRARAVRHRAAPSLAIALIDWLVWLAAFAAFGLIPARRSSPAVASTAVASRANCCSNSPARGQPTACETIRGTLVAEFAAGERTAIVHVAFCPPFERLPSGRSRADRRPRVRRENDAGPAPGRPPRSALAACQHRAAARHSSNSSPPISPPLAV